MRLKAWLDITVLCLPFVTLLLASLNNLVMAQNPAENTILFGLSAFFLWVVFQNVTGRILALALSFLLWVGFAIPLFYVLSNFFSPWLSYIIDGVILFFVSVIICQIAVDWGQQRYQARIQHGKPILEWEWVYTGKDFALSHPLSRVPFGVYLTYAFLVILFVMSILAADFFWNSKATIILFAIYGMALFVGGLLALRRHPATYPFTFLLLILEFPWSIPFLVYWADGVRPNLIYRHRFERLISAPRKVAESYEH